MPHTSPITLHLDAGTKTLAICFHVTRTDGATFAFTNHPRDLVLPDLTINGITIPADTYTSRPGCVPSDLVETDNLTPDNFQISGAVGSYVTDSSVRGNLWRGATWSLVIVNYNDLSDGMLRKRGSIGAASIAGIKFTFDCRSLVHALSYDIIHATSPLCRYRRVGEGDCPFDMTGTTLDSLPARVTATVSAVTSRKQFTLVDACLGANGDSVLITDFPVGRFTKGLVAWNTGNNTSCPEMDIQEHKTGRVIVLKWAMPFEIQVGDTITMDVGCDRQFTTCGSGGLFGVAYAFGGEPDAPTIEQVSQVQHL